MTLGMLAPKEELLSLRTSVLIKHPDSITKHAECMKKNTEINANKER